MKYVGYYVKFLNRKGQYDVEWYRHRNKADVRRKELKRASLSKVEVIAIERDGKSKKI